jgi:hypothetical protein
VRQPAGKVIEPVEVRHGQLLKRLGGKLAYGAHTRVNKPTAVLFP